MSHQDQDKAFVITFIGILGFLMLVAIVSFVVAQVVTESAGMVVDFSDPRIEQQTLERIKPVGEVEVASAASATAAGAARSGADVVTTFCAACHMTGAAGAPKIGDKAAWESRLAQGLDAMVQNAQNGVRAMPPKGTCMDCSADEIKAAVQSILEQTGISAP